MRESWLHSLCCHCGKNGMKLDGKTDNARNMRNVAPGLFLVRRWSEGRNLICVCLCVIDRACVCNDVMRPYPEGSSSNRKRLLSLSLRVLTVLRKQDSCVQVSLEACLNSWSLLEENSCVSICWEMEVQVRGGERWPVSGRVPKRTRRRWAVSGRVLWSRREMLQFRWTC